MHVVFDRLRAAGPLAVVVQLSILALAGLAATATLSGMIALFGGGWRGWLYGGILGVVVQVLIILSLRVVTGSAGLGLRGVFAVLYTILVVVSVLLGYGFWFDLTGSAGLARESYRMAMGDLLAPLTGFRHAYDDFARTAGEMADYSAIRADEERKSGGTCGGSKAAGAGPRMRLRERDAATFADFAKHFSSRAGDFGHLVESTRASVTGFAATSHQAAVAAADTALDEARALAADPRLDAFRETIRDHLAAAAGGFTDPATGERFTCPDPLLDTKLQTLAHIHLPALPTARAQLFEATHAASVHRGLHLLGGTATFDPQRDALPLAMGLAIDVMLLFLTLAARAAEEAPGRFAALERRLDPGGLLPEGHARAWMTVIADGGADPLAALVERWGLEDHGRSFLLAPIDGNEARAAQARRLASLLCALGLARRVCLRHPDQLPAWWREPRAPTLDGIDRLQLYRLRASLTQLLILDRLRQALAAGGTNADPDQPVRSARAGIVRLRRAWDEDQVARNSHTDFHDDAFIDA